MKRIILIAFCIPLLFSAKLSAQTPRPCYSDGARQALLLTHPEIAAFNAELERQISANMKKIDLRRAGMRTTGDESLDTGFVYDIPVVVHVVHDYGDEFIPDDSIFNYLLNWNIVYSLQNYDTSDVIPPFKPWIGNPHIKLHFATKDPYGNPTKGITRYRNYLTHNAGDQAKFDDWDPTSYINIWFINSMSANMGWAAAYAYFPDVAAAIPQIDGVIAVYSYAANAYDGSDLGVSKTINHEIGHVMSLYHPWGTSNTPGSADNTCADGGTDLVDDTPPTLGHLYGGCTKAPGAAVYDTVCALNYFKVYASADGTLDSLVNYPDTTNAQNIMDYTYCSRMFTKGQAVRMHAALNSSVGGRSNLWSTSNLTNTGALLPRLDLPPVPEFSVVDYVNSGNNKMQYFTCPGTSLRFYNRSWNDTVTKVKWSFMDGSVTVVDSLINPDITTSTASYVDHSFNTPGWRTVSMTATGNHTGDATKVSDSCIFVADPTGTPAAGIVEDFNPGFDLAKWPSFNYYNNEFKWELCSTAGYYDNYCMKYDGFDNRIIPALGIYPSTGSPFGDFDDIFSIPVDLSGFSSTTTCNLDFWTSGASRSANSLDINDTFQVYYSTDRGKNWILLKAYGRGDVANKGTLITAYTPLSGADWVPKTILIPPSVRGNYVIFRFRYLPGTSQGSPYPSENGIYSSGNNFYMDRVTFSQYAADVANVQTNAMDIVVAPNPTNNNAYVIIKDADNTIAKVVVSDITGKIIYTTSQAVIGNDAHIEIPASVIAIKGVYMVQATTGNQTSTQKLVVY